MHGWHLCQGINVKGYTCVSLVPRRPSLSFLTLGAHAHEGYSTQFVCLFVCLSVTSLLVSVHVYTTNYAYLPVLR